MQDLDIRGSGNLLGGEQSGFIADVGFETYQRILNEAMMELRESELHELPEKPEEQVKPSKTEEMKDYASDFQIDTDLEIMFPDEYVSSISERIRLYKELNEITNADDLESFRNRLTDRFGPVPPPAQALMDIVRLKWLAMKTGIEKILLKNNLLIANFVSDPKSRFYHSTLFVSIMNYVNRKQNRMRMKQKESRLSLTIDNIPSVELAIKVINDMLEDYRRSAN
jgi:transcription-repair coupling factor (superfamily II helicase)